MKHREELAVILRWNIENAGMGVDPTVKSNVSAAEIQGLVSGLQFNAVCGRESAHNKRSHEGGKAPEMAIAFPTRRIYLTFINKCVTIAS